MPEDQRTSVDRAPQGAARAVLSGTSWEPWCAALLDVVAWEREERAQGAEESSARSLGDASHGVPGDTDFDGALRLDRRGRLGAVLEDGEVDEIPLSEILRLRGMPSAERMALDLCHGRVLDVGAGSGVHALALMSEGLDVTTLEAQAEVVGLQRERGVADARCGDFMSGVWQRGSGEQWNTLLFMMNGLGLCRDLIGLPLLLDECQRLLRPGGIVLADGCDLRLSPAPEEAHRIALRRQKDRSFGEAVLSLVYTRGQASAQSSRSAAMGAGGGASESFRGAPFPWLYLDYATLQGVARDRGWRCQRVFDSGPDYLARLERAT